MKNYIIGTLAVLLLVCASIIYKGSIKPLHSEFPVVVSAGSREASMHLYVFFFKKNCLDCLEYIEALNHLPPQFSVFGVVPENELKDEAQLRAVSGAAFPLISNSKFKTFIPFYTPTTIGVSPSGNIIFTLPGVPGEKEYIDDFLLSLYNKLKPIL